MDTIHTVIQIVHYLYFIRIPHYVISLLHFYINTIPIPIIPILNVILILIILNVIIIVIVSTIRYVVINDDGCSIG